jgi:hypothetical protein
MADTCTKDNNDVWFGADSHFEAAVVRRPAKSAARPPESDIAAQTSKLQTLEADRSAWARKVWRQAPTAAAARGWGH